MEIDISAYPAGINFVVLEIDDKPVAVQKAGRQQGLTGRPLT